ncbi:MAG: Flagellar protein LafL [Pseudomonas citronellolis]|nr:MAG: Flagellar protein LafL [Pseudomonas citronellolis]
MPKTENPPKPDGAGKGRLKLIILLVVGVLLVVGLSIGGTWFFLGRNKPAQAEAPHAAAEEAKPGKAAAVYEPLAPAFVVNYNQNGRQRYLQVSVALMGRNQGQMDTLREQMPLVRNQLVMLFSSQNFDNLMTPVGKEMLRQQATASIQELAKKATGQLTVEQVLFTNFVLQ